jgi:hypothetical protein
MSIKVFYEICWSKLQKKTQQRQHTIHSFYMSLLVVDISSFLVQGSPSYRHLVIPCNRSLLVVDILSYLVQESPSCRHLVIPGTGVS